MGKAKASSPAQRTLILWALLAKDDGGAFQNALKPELKAPDRAILQGEGLITVSKKGTRIYVEVTDKGWQWAGEHLDAELPANAPSAGVILRAYLGRLKSFLAARNLVLADVMAPQPPPESTDLWARLRAAYLAVTGGQWNKRALLKAVRQQLGDIDRESLDAALKAFQAEAKLQLYPDDNRLELTEADKAAAVMVGGEARHILWIEQ